MKKMTTIKLEPKTKDSLNALRIEGETYDAALNRILNTVESEDDLAEAYEDRKKHHKELIEDWNAVLGDDW